ncbi:MAG: 16S rRNA methyltransferase [Candidatus Micrarchaeia archaeon]
MLTLVFAESSLEFRRGRALDANRDWRELARLEHKDKRGRPDIVHDLLKLSLDSELNKRGLLRVFVHCFDDHVITVAPALRLPRSYARFVGLMEDLNRKNKLAVDGETLLEIKTQTLADLLAEFKEEKIVLDCRGERKTLKEFSKQLKGDALVVIGGFPHGAFLSDVLDALPRCSLASEELTAPAILAKTIACAELAQGF